MTSRIRVAFRSMEIEVEGESKDVMSALWGPLLGIVSGVTGLPVHSRPHDDAPDAPAAAPPEPTPLSPDDVDLIDPPAVPAVTRESVLKAIGPHPLALSIASISSALGFDYSSSSVRHKVLAMVKDGTLQKVGPKAMPTYRAAAPVVEKRKPSGSTRCTPGNIREALGAGPLTIGGIAKALGYQSSNTSVINLVRKMASHGDLEMVGDDKYTAGPAA